MQLPDIRPDHIELVRQILQQHVPRAQAWVFGSRAKWTARDTSDLDLCINASEAITFEQMGALREAFEDSNLPYKVDVVDWATTSEAFRAIIDQSKVPLPMTGGETAKAAGRAVCGRGGVMGAWRESTWGEEISLEYGKGIRGYAESNGPYRVFGSNGAVGWADEPLAPGPGIILGRKGAYRGVRFSAEPFHVIDTAYYVVPKSELDMRWLYYAIIHHKLGEIDDGSPIPSTTRSAVYVRDFSVPPLPEQKAIAAVLSALDDKIELNRRMNETLEASARALFRDWFVDFGLVKAKAAAQAALGGPAQYDRAKASLRGSAQNHQAKAAPATPNPATLAPEIWSLFPDALDDEGKPEGWEWGTLLDQANWVNGAAYKNMDFVESTEGLPVIKIAELKAGVTGQTKFTNTDLGDRYRIADGELLFSWSGNPDTSIDAFLWTGGPAWLNQHIFAVRENGSRSKAELFVLLKWLMPEFAEIARNKQTTGLGHVTKDDMKRMKLVCPTSAIQAAFAALITPIFDQIMGNIQESRTLAQTRDMLLPKLMSGEIRVADAARAADDTAGVAR